ncbi:F-box/LRR-repeat/kelch-repeat protein [Raphanus sativus]|uniref:F-box/LRR-repeat/kelch-repeat protein At1g09650 n=1 Tax=Raphanus sativus TaxID=3726 RepID=A0A6J0K4Q8_RAPSA|nr:F-box/LRR-repeat/kelch-repeat protein At1g09650 [Raphanus sativus]XP_018442634.1 F-box/LRR-repeat/kelch-repeat protein At1g09650 [Raphanus sativus]KAJ4882745.1 F-box/LRR-repeat/kelch-repeat protein [Raphanus sativus]
MMVMMMEEGLPHDVVEHILERLPVRSLLRFKSVSKQWKATIESRHFQERQSKQHQESGGDPDVLMVSSSCDESLRTLVLGSSSSVKIPTPWDNKVKATGRRYLVSDNSCDGLVCLYHPLESGYVVNPATRWYRPLPLSRLQQLIISQGQSYVNTKHGLFKLGFGKDIIIGTYKLVWLYNSSEIDLDKNATTCEVFDFVSNAWRYVTPSAPYRVVGVADPVFVDGSLHWLTDCEETKVVSFDLHTEAFQVISSKPPFPANSHDDNPYAMVLCNLDNRLCVSHMKSPDQVIWSLNSGNKTWEKIYSIDLVMTSILYDCPTVCAFRPLLFLDAKTNDKKKKKKNLLFYDSVKSGYLLIHDPETLLDDFTFRADVSMGFLVCYFQTLISI